MKWYSVSTVSFTCAVGIEDGKILQTAPILQSFVNQPVKNLFNWLDEKFVDYNIYSLEVEPKGEEV